MRTLIIDCGATTCLYKVLINNDVSDTYSCPGFSPIVDSMDKFPRFEALDINLDRVYFYGTAMTGKNVGQAQKVLQSRFEHADISIHSDLLAAARASCKETPGYVHIIGTGSAVNFYDGHALQSVKTNMGYLWEDYASGYDISKTMIHMWFQNQLSKDEELILEDYFDSKSACLQAVYRAERPKHILAKASILLNELAPETQKKIINARLEIYFRENVDICAEHHAHHFVGSLAWLMRAEIRQKLQGRKLLEGSIMTNTMQELTAYHNHNHKSN